MRINFKILFVGLIVMLGAGCASQPQGASADEMISSAKSVDASFITAFNSGDAEGMAALYWNSPDLVVYPPDAMECKGWQALHDEYVQMAKENSGAKLQLIEPQYLVAGNYVIDHGRWKMTLASGQEMLGRYTAVMTMKDGKWVFVLDHPSVPMPPPPTSQPN